MKKYFFSLLLSILLNNATAQTIHLIMVGDVADQKFAMTTNSGNELVRRIFKTIGTNLERPLNEISFQRNSFNSESINLKSLINTITKLKTQKDDIIIFYYSGLASYPKPKKSNFPNLLFDGTNTSISFDEIGKMLLAKGTRLVLAMADCRSNILKLEIPTQPKGLKRPTIIISDLNKEIIKNLIDNTCGLVKIASNGFDGDSQVINRTILVKNGDGWTANTDQHQYSVFTLAFYDVFDQILKKTNTKITFPDLIRATQFRMNYELNPTDETNRTQKLISEIVPCIENSDNSNVMPANSPLTFSSLETKINQLIDIEDNEERAKFAQNLIAKFDKDGTIEFNIKLLPRNLQGTTSNNKREITKLGLSDYLSTITKYNPLLQSIKIQGKNNMSESILPMARIKLEEFYND